MPFSNPLLKHAYGTSNTHFIVQYLYFAVKKNADDDLAVVQRYPRLRDTDTLPTTTRDLDDGHFIVSDRHYVIPASLYQPAVAKRLSGDVKKFTNNWNALRSSEKQIASEDFWRELVKISGDMNAAVAVLDEDTSEARNFDHDRDIQVANEVPSLAEPNTDVITPGTGQLHAQQGRDVKRAGGDSLLEVREMSQGVPFDVDVDSLPEFYSDLCPSRSDFELITTGRWHCTRSWLNFY